MSLLFFLQLICSIAFAKIEFYCLTESDFAWGAPGNGSSVPVDDMTTLVNNTVLTTNFRVSGANLCTDKKTGVVQGLQLSMLGWDIQTGNFTRTGSKVILPSIGLMKGNCVNTDFPGVISSLQIGYNETGVFRLKFTHAGGVTYSNPTNWTNINYYSFGFNYNEPFMGIWGLENQALRNPIINLGVVTLQSSCFNQYNYTNWDFKSDLTTVTEIGQVQNYQVQAALEQLVLALAAAKATNLVVNTTEFIDYPTPIVNTTSYSLKGVNQTTLTYNYVNPPVVLNAVYVTGFHAFNFGLYGLQGVSLSNGAIQFVDQNGIQQSADNLSTFINMKVSVEGMVIVICVSVGIFFLIILLAVLGYLQCRNKKKIEVLEEELDEEKKHEQELEDIIKEEQAHHHPHSDTNHERTTSQAELITASAILDEPIIDEAKEAENIPEPVKKVEPVCCENCKRPFTASNQLQSRPSSSVKSPLTFKQAPLPKKLECLNGHQIRQYNRPAKRTIGDPNERLCDHCRNPIHPKDGKTYYTCDKGCSYDCCINCFPKL